MFHRNSVVVCLALVLSCAVVLALLPRSPGAEPPNCEGIGDRGVDAGVGMVVDLQTPRGRPVDPPDGRRPGPRPLICGRVLDSFGAPVAAVAVHLTLRSGGPVPEPVSTGADGRFAFPGSGYENTVVTLQVRAPGYALLLSDHVLETSSVDVGDLVLREGGGLRGRVTDLRDEGIVAAAVTLRPIAVHPLTRLRAEGELLPPAVTDAAGGFSFEHLMPGTYRLEASAVDRQRFLHRQPIVIEEGRTDEVEPIRLGPGFRLVGRVFDPKGTPLAGARVRVRSEDRRQRFDERFATDPDGRFSMAHVPGAPLAVSVHGEGFLGWRRTGIDPELGQSLVVCLEEGLRISGVVVDAGSGAPVEQFSVRVRHHGPLRIPVDLELVHRPGGAFVIEGLDEGVYSLEVSSPDYQVTSSGALSLSRETGSRSLQLALQAGLRVGGIVVAKDRGEPLPGVRVELSTGSELVMSARTGVDGRFAFENAPAGAYLVTARQRERETVDIGPLEVAADRDDLLIELGRTASLRGRVRDVPTASGGIVVLAIGGAVTQAARMEPDGSYEIRGLQPGNYAVRAVAGPVRLSPLGLRVPRSIDARSLSVDVVLREGEQRVYDPVVSGVTMSPPPTPRR